MKIRTDDALLKAANKAMTIAVIVYVIVKQVTYMVMFESVYWIPRGCAGILMLILAFGLPRIKFLTKQHLSWLVPLSLALTEIILVACNDGDRLIYIFLIGIALLSLLYMDTRGLLITAIVSCAAAAFCLFVWGRTLIGEVYDIYDDIFNFLGLIVVDILIFLIGKYGIGTLMESKQVVEDSLFDAQNANRAKTNFLATMSHEIRTPMNAILGIAQLQLQEEDLPEKYANAVNGIIDSGNTLLTIINDILDMSKIESGNMELVLTQFDLAGFINDSVKLNIVRLGSNPIEFRLDIDENLPVRLYGDELRLKQILNNLLSNAIKYTEKGEVKLSVSVVTPDNNELIQTNGQLKTDNGKLPAEVSESGNNYPLSASRGSGPLMHYPLKEDEERVTLNFTVSDTGQGIRPEDIEKLFSAEYTRFNAEANRTKEGTGLGLSITKRLVEMMDGTITVESEYGKGSVFSVSVKLRVIDPAPIGPAVAAGLRDFTYVGSKYKERRKIVRNLMPYGRILVVDDVESNLLIVEGMLAKYKLNTETVSSGFQALEKVKGGKVYDVIFMDHMMPQMDGIETTQKIRAMGYSGTVIALTANALVGNDEMFCQNGFDGFIAKPIDIQKLDVLLNRFVRDRNPEEAAKVSGQAGSSQAGSGQAGSGQAGSGQAGSGQAGSADTGDAADVADAAEIVDAGAAGGTGDNVSNDKLHRAFCRDAATAISALREAAVEGDIKKTTAAAHSMKSALANIGENELSLKAAALESAGLGGDNEYIIANADGFVKALETLISKLQRGHGDNRGESRRGGKSGHGGKSGSGGKSGRGRHDAKITAEQLEIVVSACENYDDDTAIAALKQLQDSTGNADIAEAIDTIYDAIFIDSDFERAAELAKQLKTKQSGRGMN